MRKNVLVSLFLKWLTTHELLLICCQFVIPVCLYKIYILPVYKITKTIIEFAKSLNLKTIAEYVENEEIFNLIKDLGSDYSQGYYFSAPIPEPNLYEFKGNINE